MKIKLFLIIHFLILSSCSSGSYANSDKEYLNQIRIIERAYFGDIKRRYDAHIFGVGGALMNQVEDLYYSFEINRCVGVDESRKIYVGAMQDLLDKVNSNEKIRPSLSHYPYTYKGVSLFFFFYSAPFVKPPKANVALVAMKNDMIEYFYWDQSKNDYIVFKSEPFEEAVKIVK